MPMIPDLDLRRIDQFCADQTPEHVRDQVRWEAHVRGTSVTICETHAPWDDSSEAWTHQGLAPLRYRPDTGNWALHWADRNSRWHVYDVRGRAMVGPCAALLAEIDADPTSIFKG